MMKSPKHIGEHDPRAGQSLEAVTLINGKKFYIYPTMQAFPLFWRTPLQYMAESIPGLQIFSRQISNNSLNS